MMATEDSEVDSGLDTGGARRAAPKGRGAISDVCVCEGVGVGVKICVCVCVCICIYTYKYIYMNIYRYT